MGAYGCGWLWRLVGCGRSPRWIWWPLMLAVQPLLAGDFDVVISELHYHPPDGTPAEEAGEFVELANLSDDPVDLSGWVIDGGISYALHPGIVIDGNGYIVIARDAEYLQSAYGISEVYGNFAGRLSNGSDSFSLRNAAGVLVDHVQYYDDSPWPETPDGQGPSLEKKHLTWSGEEQASWRASIPLGGTPGRRNSTDIRRRNQTLIAAGDTWRYRKGTEEPALPLGSWADPDFDDSSWDSGPSGFGYGDDDDATVLSDMEGEYVAVYLRKTFTIPSLEGVDSMSLSVVYDDAYVAYLNGIEVSRSVTAGGTPGEPLPYDTRAEDGHENDEGDGYVDLLSFGGLLLVGENVLAIQGLNISSSSSDLSLIPALSALYEDTTGEVEPPHDLEINEVFAGSGPTEGFVEIYNEGLHPVDLEGYRLTRDPVAGDSGYVFPAGSTLEAAGFLTVSALDIPFALSEEQQWMGLLTPDYRVVDGIESRARPVGTSWGRYPDGDGDTFVLDGPSPSAPNAVTLEDRVVINEIQFHPPLAVSSAEYVELHNRGNVGVDISGWSLVKAVDYTFPPGSTIPAGGFLIVSGNPALVTTRYSIADVYGPWDGRLANSEEKVELEDALGNTLDTVHYADDGRWPLSTETEGPDGFGPSIELVHPGMENNHGSAWLASTGLGTPGTQNGAYESDPPPVIRSVVHTPSVPDSTSTVTVTARVSDESLLESVKVYSRSDGATTFYSVAMADDGLHGDGSPGDGRWGAILSPLDDGTVVQFYVEARDTSGHVRRYPSDAPERVCLYQVDDATYPRNLPLYRAILRGVDLEELIDRDLDSDVLLDGTFIHGDDVTYNVGVRYRGEHSREYAVKSFRIQFTDDESFDGITDLNLNAEGSLASHLAADFFRRADMPVFQTRPVAYTLNRSWNARHGGIYLRVEHVDRFFLERQFPGDSDGNLYRGLNPSGEGEADLSYRGSDPDDYLSSYAKRTNQEENDYSDVIELTRVFTETPDEEFAEAIGEIIDVPQWIRYLAVETVLNNRDGCISRTSGEDYFLYRRPSDDLWVLIPWDQNETFTEPGYGIFRQEIEAIERLVLNPAFLPLYEQELLRLLDGAFSEEAMAHRTHSVLHAFALSDLNRISSFVVSRGETIRELLSPLDQRSFIRGDANGDALVDISDSVKVLLYLFVGTQAPECLDTADADDSGDVELTDAVFILQFLFQRGPPPPSPYPEPGLDPTPGDDYTCLAR